MKDILLSARRLDFQAFALFLCLIFGPGLTALAQHPVQVNTLLRPPYSLQLSDYYTSTQEKLVVTLTNRDLNKPVLQVRLRMTIESQGVTLRSRDFANLPTLSLDAGIPLRLSLTDLAPYFNSENLDFAGISRAQYARQAKLPEGFYQFCFEAIEISTGQVASAKSCAMAWMSLSDPPFLNLPRKDEAIAFKEPQNIIFQWTPRHLNSPNSAYQTEYDFQLAELWDTTLAPEVAFQTTQPLYEVTTRTTTLLYGPAQPMLIAGKRYAWRVRARARSGVEDVDVFRNQGYSEIYWFTYQDLCPAPTGVAAAPGTFGNLEFSWTAANRHSGYMVTYRQKDKEGATWFDQQSSAAPALVYDVQPGVVYEYRIGAFCNTDQPVFSAVHTVTLPPRETTAFANCSLVPDAQITNRQVLQVLQPGDVITAGNFPVKVDHVIGSGAFTGKGYVTVPFLGRAKVRVKFQGIQVNTQKQLIAGTVITTYDEDEGSVIDVDEGLDIFKDYQGVVSHLQELTADTDIETLKKVLDKLTERAATELIKEQSDNVKNTVDSLLEAKGTYDQIKAVYDALPDGDPLKTSLKKDLDDAYAKFEEIKSQLRGIATEAVSSEKYLLTFGPTLDRTTYAMDAYREELFPHLYDVEEHGGEKYFITWKAVAEGESDWVSAYTLNFPENVVFRSQSGTLESNKITDVETHVKVYGSSAGIKNQIVAYQQKEIEGKQVDVEIGKLNVVSYPKQYRKLILVQVNDAPLIASKEEITRGLNEIYNPVLVYWTVEIQTLSSNYDRDGNGLADDMDIIKRGNYTAEMKHIIRDYAGKEITNQDDHYLFLVSRSESGKVSGVNLYQHQAGFIISNTILTAEFLNHVIAHEIGHGAFRFYHTFDDDPASYRMTDNLMDYSPASEYGHGSALNKFQWDRIHKDAAPILLVESGEAASQDSTTTDSGTAPLDAFDQKVLAILTEYREQIQQYTSRAEGNGEQAILPACLEAYQGQLDGVGTRMTTLIASSDSLKKFVQSLKEQIFDRSDDNQLKSFVCQTLVEGLPFMEMAFLYDGVMYKDGECVYVDPEDTEIKLSVTCTRENMQVDPGSLTWQGADGRGAEAVVKLDHTSPDDHVVIVASPFITSKVQIRSTAVRIVSIDRFFAPTVETLDILYDVTSAELKYARVEVFKSGDDKNPVYVMTGIPAGGRGMKVSWDGKMNAGQDIGSYIGVHDSPYTVKISASADEMFDKGLSDIKPFGVEVQSITLTPNGTLSLIKPDPAATEIVQDIEALVKIRNKQGKGVTAALPLTLSWSYEDPDDIANDPKGIIDINGNKGDDNAARVDGGKWGEWKAYSGYVLRVLPLVAESDVTPDTRGSTRLGFSSSVIAGDNYILVARVKDRAGKTLKEAKTGTWTVRKKVIADNIYEMAGSYSMARMMSKSNIDPAFSKDGCTDYTVASNAIIKLSESPEFLAPLLTPDPVRELPTAAELLDYSFSPDARKSEAAEKSIQAKAQSWFNRNYINSRKEVVRYVARQGIKPNAIIGALYLHPKSDGNPASGKTNFYPPGILINVADPGEPPHLAHPDDEWIEVQGLEELESRNTWFFMNVSGEGRRRVAGRHEIGHASDHTEFGRGDHAAAGLMESQAEWSPKNPAGNPEFSDDSIVKLRGRIR